MLNHMGCPIVYIVLDWACFKFQLYITSSMYSQATNSTLTLSFWE